MGHREQVVGLDDIAIEFDRRNLNVRSGTSGFRR
jgi:hypothetical protein